MLWTIQHPALPDLETMPLEAISEWSNPPRWDSIQGFHERWQEIARKEMKLMLQRRLDSGNGTPIRLRLSENTVIHQRGREFLRGNTSAITSMTATRLVRSGMRIATFDASLGPPSFDLCLERRLHPPNERPSRRNPLTRGDSISGSINCLGFLRRSSVASSVSIPAFSRSARY